MSYSYGGDTTGPDTRPKWEGRLNQREALIEAVLWNGGRLTHDLLAELGVDAPRRVLQEIVEDPAVPARYVEPGRFLVPELPDWVRPIREQDRRKSLEAFTE